MRTTLRDEIERLKELAKHPDPDVFTLEDCAFAVRRIADQAAKAGQLDFYDQFKNLQAITPRDAVAALSSLLHGLSDGLEYLTVDQVASRLQVSKDSIYDLINQGLLKHSRVGRLIRIRQEDLKHIHSEDGGW